MEKIKIADVTLTEYAGEKSNLLTFKEKVELCKILEKMNVDIIDLAPITNEKTDYLLYKTVASFVKNAVLALPVGFEEKGIDTAWDVLSFANKARLQVCLPVSAVQMEYICGKKPAEVLETIKKLVAKCKAVCPNVEFIAQDATRSEKEFLFKAVETAITAGATTVTICDCAGIMLPWEFKELLTDIIENVPAVKDVSLGVKCGNNIKMATATAFAAVSVGAREIKAVCYGETLPDITSITDVVKAKGSSIFSCNINTAILERLTNQVKWILETNKKVTSPFDNGVRDTDETTFTLDSASDITAVTKAAENLGYQLNEEDTVKVYEAFCRIALKKTVSAKELDAIVASAAMQVPPTYTLKNYVINSGNVIAATANIQLVKDDKTLQGISIGDGPIDAAFLAIEQIIGYHYELDDFQIQSVTEGREAMGSALVKLRYNGKLYSGNGLSTDIIGASIRAYINALNKIVCEEK